MDAFNETALRAGQIRRWSGQAVEPRKPARTMGQLRRYTLVLLRWGAIGGQILALFIVSQVLKFPLPVTYYLLVTYCILFT